MPSKDKPQVLEGTHRFRDTGPVTATGNGCPGFRQGCPGAERFLGLPLHWFEVTQLFRVFSHT